MTEAKIIEISKKIPIEKFDQAVKIAQVFRDKKLVYIPGGMFFMDFWRMITAIWYGGYIAGVQAERKKRRSH